MSPIWFRIAVVSTAILLAITGALALEVLLSTRPDRPFGHSSAGHATGWLALSIIAQTLIYPVQKRRAAERHWPKRWFQVHMIAGIAGPAMALTHAGAHWHALVPISALAALAVLTLSGVIGQAVHYFILRTLHEKERGLAQDGVGAEEIEERLHALAGSERMVRVWQYLHAPMTVIFFVLVTLHVAGALYFGGL
jgi:hypothetical protein